MTLPVCLLAGNKLTRGMTPADRFLLETAGEPAELRQGKVLFEPGEPITHAHFPLDGAMISLVVVMSGRRVAEVATVGSEGAVGIGPDPADDEAPRRRGLPFRGTVQLPGRALRVPLSPLARAAAGSPSLYGILARYADTPATTYARWNAAAAALLPVKDRLAKSLLLAHDRASAGGPCAADRALPFSQEFLARMLAVRRASVNAALAELEEAGAIRRRHGGVWVTDREILKQACRDTYEAVSTALGIAPEAEQG